MTGFEAERRRLRWGRCVLMQAKATRFGASTHSIGSFGRILRQQSGIGVAKDAQKSHPGFSTTGNPGNVD